MVLLTFAWLFASGAQSSGTPTKSLGEQAANLRRQISQRPADANLWNLLGITEAERKDFDAAERAFRRGLQLAPDSTVLNENAGLFYLQQSKYGEAKQRLARAVRLGSDKPSVRFSLASAELRSGEPKEALQTLRELEPALGGLEPYWEERGRAELTSDATAASGSFARALALDPHNIADLNGAATAAEKQGLDEKALAYLIRARQDAPDDVPTLLHFGAVCIRRDLGPDAVKAVERARTLDPQSLPALYLLARANISVGNWQHAHDLFAEFARRAPKFAPAYYAMGWLDEKLDRTAPARTELQHALTLDPALQDDRCELAKLELADGQTERAKELLQAVLRQQPQHTEANVTLGGILLQEGNLEAARKLLETAATQSPDLAAAHYRLSLVYARLHDDKRAARERKVAANLAERDKRASKTQLRLVLPEDAGTAGSRR